MANITVTQELKAKLEAERLTTKPTSWCGITPNYHYPRVFYSEGGARLEVMELFIDLNRYFIRNARGWGQLDFRNQGNYCYWLKVFFQLIGKLAKQCKAKTFPTAITCEMIPRRPARRLPEEALDVHNLDRIVYDRLKQERAQEEFLGMRLRLAVNFSKQDENGNRIVRPGEPVPQEWSEGTDSKAQPRPQGPVPTWCSSLGEFTQDILENNRKELEKDERKPKFKNASPRLELDSLVMAGYRSMCVTLCGWNYPVDESHSNCSSDRSVYNPVNAFKGCYSSLILQQAGAKLNCCNGDNYERLVEKEDGSWERKLLFPNPEHVYRISIVSFSPEDQINRYLPHIRQPAYDVNIEKKAYVESHAYDLERIKNIPNEERKQIKIGFRTHRQNEQFSSEEKVREIMFPEGSPYVLAEESKAEDALVQGTKSRMDEDSDAEPEPPNEDVDNPMPDLEGSAPAVIEGLDLMPPPTVAAACFDQVVMVKPSIAIPEYGLEEFDKESTRMYKLKVDSIQKMIPNKEWIIKNTTLERHWLKRDIQKLKELRKQLNQEVSQTIVNPAWTKARHEFLIGRFIDFEKHIWHEDACVPDSIKALCILERKHLTKTDGSKNNKNFSMPTEKTTSNLSPFGDMMVNKMNEMDAAHEVFTVHSHILTGTLACLQVFFDSIFHAHMLLAGPARAGKSFTEQKIAANLCEGTFRWLTYETAKAKTGAAYKSPHQYSQLCEFYEEIIPAVLGVGNEYGDQTAILKNLLTKGEISYSSLEKDANGERFNEYKTAKVNNLFIASTNAYFSQMPPPVTSRFITITYQCDERPDRGGVSAKISDKSTARKEASRLSNYKWMRDQLFVAKSAYFMKAVSCMLGLNEGASGAVFAIIAEAAAKDPALRGFDDVRKIEQLRFLTQPLACMEANHIVLDSDRSVIKDLEWHPTHFLQLIPHWRTTVEHAVFALGLIEHQFEDQIKTNVLDMLIKVVFTEDEKPLVVAPTGRITADADVGEQGTIRRPSLMSGDDDEMYNHTIDDTFGFSVSERIPRAPPAPVPAPGTYSSANKLQDADLHYWSVDMNRIGLSTSFRRADNTSTGRAETSGILLDRLASILETKMRPRPQHGDIMGVLEELTLKMMDSAEYDAMKQVHINKKMPVFELDTVAMKLKILKEFLKDGTSIRRKLKKCIETKLAHPYAAPATFIYGAAHDSHPNLLDVVEIKPSDQNEKLRMVAPDYFHKNVQQSIIQALKNVVEEKIDDPIPINWEEMFAANQLVEIDIDIDDYFISLYNEKMQYTNADMLRDPNTGLPMNHPRVIFHDSQAAAGDYSRLPSYPGEYKLQLEGSHKRKCTSMKDRFEKNKRKAGDYHNVIVEDVTENVDIEREQELGTMDF